MSNYKLQEVASAECGRACTIRLGFYGTRMLVCSPSTELRAYMASKGVTNANPDSLLQFFKGMSKDTIDRYLSAGHKLYQATLGPHDAAVLPSDYAWFESVGKEHDVLGLRISLYLKSDLDAMEETNKWLIAMKNQFVPSDCARKLACRRSSGGSIVESSYALLQPCDSGVVALLFWTQDAAYCAPAEIVIQK